jgi:hypothetical protein
MTTTDLRLGQRPAPAAETRAEPTRPPGSPLVGRAAVGLVLGLALVKGLSPFSEPDVWWHLRVGELIRSGSGLTFTDPSASLATRPYVATQWLPEAVTSAAYDVWGTGAVVWLRAAAIVLLVAAVYWACRRTAGRLPSAVVAGLTLIGAGGGLNPRPQLVSFVLFAVTVHAWCGMVQDRRPRWWLVPLFWVWACSHGLWTFGLAVGAVLLAATTADPATRPSRRELGRLAGLWGACLAAVAATPLGPQLLATPLQVAGNASWIAEEWRATPLNNVFSWAALVMVASTSVLWLARPAQRPWWQLALLGLGAACVLWMWRLVPLGCVAVAPLLAGALQECIVSRREPVGARERRALVVGVVALLAVAAAVTAGPSGADAQRFPEDVRPVDAALARLPEGTVVMADFGVSGWLLNQHPELTPVADLRGEIYSQAHLKAYAEALTAKPGWLEFVESTGAGAAVLRSDAPLSGALAARAGWVTTARTATTVLLTPRQAPGDR